MQTPAVHLSPTVQAFASLQVAAPLPDTHPRVGSHTKSVHTPALAQSFTTPGWQEPLEHASLVVQALPSSQGAALLDAWQPVCGRQKSVVQGLPSSHAVSLITPGRQVPPEHASPTVQALLSVQVAVFAKCTQPVCALQESSVHGSPSLQVPSSVLPSQLSSMPLQTSGTT